MQHFSLIQLRLSFCYSPPRVGGDGGPTPRASVRFAAAAAKKNAGNNAGVGILFLENQQVFQGKRRLARLSRGRRQKQ
jgi:hypothetical protein